MKWALEINRLRIAWNIVPQRPLHEKAFGWIKEGSGPDASHTLVLFNRRVLWVG